MKKKLFLLMIIIFLVFSGCSSTGGSDRNMVNDFTIIESIAPEDVKNIVDNYTSYPDIDIIDVRSEQEFDEGHIEGAINIPVERIEEINISTDEEIIVYCRSGRRSHDAAEKLIELGYKNVKDMGGINDWKYELVES